jgi:hypothetical protein
VKPQIMTLLFGLAALAHAAAAQDGQRLTASLATDTPNNSVTVQNDRKVPLTVYMEYGDFDRRLGIVPALRTTSLSLPAWAVRGRDRIQLFVHPEGAVNDLATREFSLKPPARIGMLIPASGTMAPAPADAMMEVIPPEEIADATVTVDNSRGKAVTVFAEQGEFDVRLGEVPAHGRVTLRFPKSVVHPNGTLQLFVHPEGGIDLSSETLHVRSGEHLGLRVPVQ